jgi:hypothetical protein
MASGTGGTGGSQLSGYRIPVCPCEPAGPGIPATRIPGTRIPCTGSLGMGSLVAGSIALPHAGLSGERRRVSIDGPASLMVAHLSRSFISQQGSRLGLIQGRPQQSASCAITTIGQHESHGAYSYRACSHGAGPADPESKSRRSLSHSGQRGRAIFDMARRTCCPARLAAGRAAYAEGGLPRRYHG